MFEFIISGINAAVLFNGDFSIYLGPLEIALINIPWIIGLSASYVAFKHRKNELGKTGNAVLNQKDIEKMKVKV